MLILNKNAVLITLNGNLYSTCVAIRQPSMEAALVN